MSIVTPKDFELLKKKIMTSDERPAGFSPSPKYMSTFPVIQLNIKHPDGLNPSRGPDPSRDPDPSREQLNPVLISPEQYFPVLTVKRIFIPELKYLNGVTTRSEFQTKLTQYNLSPTSHIKELEADLDMPSRGNVGKIYGVDTRTARRINIGIVELK